MKFYKSTNGQWILDSGIIPAGSCRYTLTGSGLLTIYLLNGFALYKGQLTALKKEDGSFYEDEEDFLTNCAPFFVNPLNPLKEDVEGLREDVSAIQGGYLGTLLHTDAAPEPGVSGIYKFISAGVVSWLSGTPTVAVGDEVSVVFTDPTYTYTHIQNPHELLANKQNNLVADGTGSKYPTVDAVNGMIEPVRSQSITKAPTSKLLDDELTKVANTERPIADIFAHLLGRIETLEELLVASRYNAIQVNELSVVDNLKFKGADLFLFGTEAPAVTPDFVGQFFVNTTGGVTYQAKGIVNSGDWKQTSN